MRFNASVLLRARLVSGAAGLGAVVSRGGVVPFYLGVDVSFGGGPWKLLGGGECSGGCFWRGSVLGGQGVGEGKV